MHVDYTDVVNIRQDILITNDSVNSQNDAPPILYTRKTVTSEKQVLRILPDWTVEPDVEPVQTTVMIPHKKEDLPFVSPVYVPQTEGSIEIWAGASLVKAKRPPKHVLRVGADRGGGKRGKITSFSKSARWRMMQKIAKVRNSVLPTFLTLTYPGEYSHDSAVWKRDLDTFFKRVRRMFPGAAAVWKMEPQKRGAPHFHLLVWGVNRWYLDAWSRAAWYDVVGSKDNKHFVHGTKVEEIRTWRGVKSYVSKYLGKMPDVTEIEGWEYPGRWWGVFAADNLPWGECIKVGLPLAESKLIIRTMRKYAKIKGRDFSFSLTIVCDNATRWYEVLDRLIHWSAAS